MLNFARAHLHKLGLESLSLGRVQQQLLEKRAARSAQISLALHGWEGSSNNHCGAQATNSPSATNTYCQKVESTFLPLIISLGSGEVGWYQRAGRGTTPAHPAGWCETSPCGRAWKFRGLRELFREITVMRRWSCLCSSWLGTGRQAQHRSWAPFMVLPRATQALTALSDTSVLLSCHVPFGSSLMYSCHCYGFGFLQLSITASGVLLFVLQCSYRLGCGIFPN